MAEVATPTRLLKQAQLADALQIASSTIDNYIQRYPTGHPNAFPVERIGRTRRYDFEAVRAWFAAMADGFPESTTTAA